MRVGKFFFNGWFPLVLIAGISASNAYAQITSTFDTDVDGWTFSDQNLNPQPVTYNNAGGNPGGNVSSTIGGQVYYWTSPAKFNGNIAYFSYGQILSFDLQSPVTPTIHGLNGYDVAIRLPSGGELVHTLPSLPAVAPVWSSYTVRLDETTEWFLGSPTGPRATKEQLKEYLSSVASLRINGKFVSASCGASASLDNVRLEQRTIQAAPSISSFSITSGKPGSSLTIIGNNFGSTISNNAVYFGLMQGTITSANSTSLTVTVPAGAQYGSVTIINKTTGLSKNSNQPFIPTFDDGGRIIPASFNPKFDIITNVYTSGLSVADVDGDGWNDLILANANNTSVDVYRNMALGGTLTASSFAAKVSFNTGGSGTNAAGLRMMDLDGDAKLDVVTSIIRSAFVGSFATFRNISTPGNLAFEAVEYWDGRSDGSPVYNIADIDGDGLADLMSGESSGGAGQNVWITQNISTPGNIEFNYSLFYFDETFDDGALGAILGDLDNDSKPEVILTTGQGLSFAIIKNTSTPGSISFGIPFTLAQVTSGGIQVADFNQDGKNDLAWKNGSTNDDVHIRINTNSGGALAASDFATEVILNCELNNYGAISLADINGDSKVDIIANDGVDFALFENVFAGGAFSVNSFVRAYKRPGDTSGTPYPSSIVAGDLNGDGKPDMVFGSTNATPQHVSIIENKNVHTPVISLSTVSPLAGSVGSTVTITGDYFSTTSTDNLVQFGTVKATVITATKTQLTVTVPPGAQYAPVSVTRDRLTSTYYLPFRTIFSTGTSFDASSFAVPINFTLTAASYEVIIDDLNIDGKPDVVATGGTFDTYAFKNSHSSGSISTTSLIVDDTVQNYLPSFRDLDGDGKADLIVNNGQVHQNLSTLSEINFANGIEFEFSSFNHSYADFDHDGKIDFVGTRSSENKIIVTTNKTTPGSFVFFNGNQADFASFDIGIMAIGFSKPAVSGYTATADFDNDGWVDIVATNSATDNFTVWKNNQTNRISTASFTNVGNITTGDNPDRIYTGDLDIDGKVDLMLYYSTGTSSGIISIFRNTSTAGTISFARQDYIIGDGSNGGASAIGDLDGDGKPEIVVPSEAANVFRIFKNNTTPGIINATSFIASPTYAVITPRAVTIGDINLDGRPEIIITAAPNSLLVYENLIPATVVTVTVNTQPVNATVCAGVTATFTTVAAGTTNIAYQWQKKGTDLTFVDLTNDTNYSGVATATLSVNTIDNFGAGFYRCRINGDLVTEVVTNETSLLITPSCNNVPPVILTSTSTVPIEGVVTVNLLELISDPDNNLDLSTLTLLTSISQQGASASINSLSELVLDYGGVLFFGSDKVTIAVCDLSGACAQQELTIEVSGDITVYNAFSPNGDGKNESFTIQYIDILPDTQSNKVTIYNRWGDEVFEIDDYDNNQRVFVGLNKNNKELPSGIYFYKIEFTSGRESKKGFLALKR